ncbi:LysR family transcriptional regulator [uncultured Roseibium sp.]|uniref:LysR family transcriptional regulator n=1 Tax=uncultured Roseibium sp. TaxID=1936171 RepID=UPI0026229DAE|nr:LysR family transcriptional regulator [uncultured Roseibium sp.]
MPVAPPIPRIPSLNALRAFEASARLGGFALAAEELNVTPGAVAAQVKSLEQEIGASLFVRNARGVELTPVGQRSTRAFVEVFDSLSQAVRELRQDAAPQKVHIAALPALAQLWLAPRLPGLRARIPDLDVSVTALETPPNLKRVPFDLCLFYSDVVPQGGVQLQKDELLPVCSPECARHLKRPADLNKVACLTDTAWVDDWAIWAAHACPGIGLVPRGPVFSLYSLAVEEAISGAGVLMGHTSLVEQHLRSGALVAPFPKRVPLPRAITMWRLPEGRSSEVEAELQRLSGNVD